MKNSTFTLQDVVESAEKFGRENVLFANVDKARDLKQKNPKSPYDVAYVDIGFKRADGTILQPAKLKITEQLIASSAMAPHGTEEGVIPKKINIAFTVLEKEDIETGDYVPKKKDSDEDQTKENKRSSDNNDRYMTNNKDLNNAMSILDASYKSLCAELIKNKDSYKFKIQKDRKMKEIPVFSIKQETRIDKDTQKDVKLPNPIYRVNLQVVQKPSDGNKEKEKCQGKIGIYSYYSNSFKPTVFDARKMTKANRYQPVPAKVKASGKYVDINYKNAKSFITRKSLVGGHIVFECIVASKFGLSLNCSFYDLFVYRYKTKNVQNSMTPEEIMQMRGGASEDNDSSDSDVDDEKNEDEGDKNEEIKDSDDDIKDSDDDEEVAGSDSDE